MPALSLPWQPSWGSLAGKAAAVTVGRQQGPRCGAWGDSSNMLMSLGTVLDSLPHTEDTYPGTPAGSTALASTGSASGTPDLRVEAHLLFGMESGQQ